MAEKKYRDSLFRHYFMDDKRRLLSLLNALLGTNVDDPDEIEINTLEGLFFSAVKNDISCVFQNRQLILLEHQSTLNENMPMRMLFYLVELMKRKVNPSTQVFDEPLIKFPAPSFFVIYNGLKKAPEQREMNLSDAFNGSPNISLKVQFLNVNAGHNRELISKSRSLNNYCIFIDRVAYNRKRGMSIKEAIREAPEYCIREDVMAEYLRVNFKEAMKMYWFEYNADEERAAIERGAFNRGVQQGAKQNKLEMIKNLIKAGTPLNFIEAATGWTEEQILAVAGTDNA